MNEYQIKYKVWDTGGFLPDLFGTQMIHFVKADSAQEAMEEFEKQMERVMLFQDAFYKLIEISKV